MELYDVLEKVMVHFEYLGGGGILVKLRFMTEFLKASQRGNQRELGMDRKVQWIM